MKKIVTIFLLIISFNVFSQRIEYLPRTITSNSTDLIIIDQVDATRAIERDNLFGAFIDTLMVEFARGSGTKWYFNGDTLKDLITYTFLIDTLNNFITINKLNDTLQHYLLSINLSDSLNSKNIVYEDTLYFYAKIDTLGYYLKYDDLLDSLDYKGVAFVDSVNIFTDSISITGTGGGIPLKVNGIDQRPVMLINNGANSSFIEFTRSNTLARSSVGMLGGLEANLSYNMNYATGVHKYYDSLQNATWLAINEDGAFLQFTQSGWYPGDIFNGGRGHYNWQVDTSGTETLRGNLFSQGIDSSYFLGNLSLGKSSNNAKLDILIGATDAVTNPLSIDKGLNNYVELLNNGNLILGGATGSNKLTVIGGHIEVDNSGSAYFILDRGEVAASDSYIWHKSAGITKWLTGMGVTGGAINSDDYRITDGTTSRFKIDRAYGTVIINDTLKLNNGNIININSPGIGGNTQIAKNYIQLGQLTGSGYGYMTSDDTYGMSFRWNNKTGTTGFAVAGSQLTPLATGSMNLGHSNYKWGRLYTSKITDNTNFVGINNASPVNMLDIIGNLRVSDTIKSKRIDIIDISIADTTSIYDNGSNTIIDADNTLLINNNIKIIGKGDGVTPFIIDTFSSGDDHKSFLVTGTYGANTAHPIVVNTNHPLAENQAVAFFDAAGTISGNAHSDHAVSYQSALTFSGTDTINDLYGVFDAPTCTNGFIQNRYGIFITDMNSQLTRFGNNVGVYISNLSKGTDNVYSIYAAGDEKAYFGGDVQINDTLFLNKISGNLITDGYISANSTSDSRIKGKLFIGNNNYAPDANLEVWSAYGSESKIMLTQSGYNEWWIKSNAGDVNFSMGDIVGTYLTIENLGDVGVGITNPIEKLHVNGDIKSDSIKIKGLKIYDTSLTDTTIIYDNGTNFIIDSDNSILLNNNLNINDTLYTDYIKVAPYWRSIDTYASQITLGATYPEQINIDQWDGLSFDADGELIYIKYELPKGWITNTDIKFIIYLMSEAGDNLGNGETIKFNIEYKSKSEGESMTSGTVATATGTYTQSGTGGDSQFIKLEITMPYNDVNQPLSANDLIGIKLNRDKTNDTYSGDAICLKFELYYQINTIGIH